MVRRHSRGKRKLTEGRKKVKIEYVPEKDRRQTTFSKRRDGLMKKAFELSKLTNCEILIFVASETAHIYTFATPGFRKFSNNLKKAEFLVQHKRGEGILKKESSTESSSSAEEEL